jgi:hypothetical protein
MPNIHEVMEGWNKDIHALCDTYGMEGTQLSHRQLLFLSGETGRVQCKE